MENMVSRSDRGRDYLPAHAKQRRLAGAIIACIAVIIIVAGIIYIVAVNPKWLPDHATATPSPKPQAQVCRAYSGDTTVELTKVVNCGYFYRVLAGESGGTWTTTTVNAGQLYATLRHSGLTVRIFCSGNTTLAEGLTLWFKGMGWK